MDRAATKERVDHPVVTVPIASHPADRHVPADDEHGGSIEPGERIRVSAYSVLHHLQGLYIVPTGCLRRPSSSSPADRKMRSNFSASATRIVTSASPVSASRLASMRGRVAPGDQP